MRPRSFMGPLLALALTLGLTTGVAAAPATTFTQVTIVPIAFLFEGPCAAEPIAISGNIHDLFHVTLPAGGGGHVTFEDNPQGVSGIGTVTGTKWQGTGVTRDGFSLSVVPYTETFIDNFLIVGPGRKNNFVVQHHFHITVNANGTVTSFHDNFTVTCR